MAGDIKIEYDDREVVAALNRLGRAGRDLTPAMREIAAALEDAALEAFERQETPGGDPWSDLTDVTKARRERQGHWPGQILQDAGGLVGSLTGRYDAHSAVSGANLPYAAKHQLGHREPGEARVPGRSDDLDAEILDAVARRIAEALRG